MTTVVECNAVKEADITNRYMSVLKDTGYEVDNLPQLDLKGMQGHTDYIDFITPRDMTSPVMTFRDRFNRPGIAILLATKKSCSNVEVIPETLCNVLALFQRYTEDARCWSYGWGDSDGCIENLYNDYHSDHGHTGIMACKECPFANASINTNILKNILQGTDPILELGIP